MSKKRSNEDYEKSFSFRFGRWMRGEKDPYIGVVEMKPQPHPVLEDEMFETLDYGEKKKKAPISENEQIKRFRKFYVISSILLCIALCGFLIYAVSYLPPVGHAENPSNNEVSKVYIEEGLSDTGAVNLVAGVIATYRAFDTFGETNVLFIATCVVMIILMIEQEDKRKALGLDDFGNEPRNDVILKSVAKVVCPMLFLFGIYVILNGHISPGGGFSGGAIIGSGMILHAAAFEFTETQKFFNEHIYVIVKVTALMIYGLIAIYFFVSGANGLDCIFPKGIPGAIISGGIILPINICVGVEVACTIYAFYALFRRGGL